MIRMTAKRFYMDKSGDLYDKENGLLMLDFGYSYDGVNCKRIIDLLNELHETNEQLRHDATILIQSNHDYRKENDELKSIKRFAEKHGINIFKIDEAFQKCWNDNGKLIKENNELKKDGNSLVKLLENQSIIIQELHSELMSYQLKEPIVLTKEDLEIMGKAISYYTHGGFGE